MGNRKERENGNKLKTLVNIKTLNECLENGGNSQFHCKCLLILKSNGRQTIVKVPLRKLIPYKAEKKENIFNFSIV